MRTPVAAVIWVLAVVPAARAQQPRSLTEHEAIVLAEERAPEVLTSLAQASVTRADADVAGALPNPQIGGGASPAYLAIATFTMRLPVFGQSVLAERAASARAMVDEASVEVRRLGARLAASLAWIDLWTVERETALVEEEVARYERTLASAEARVEEGTAPELDRIRADADARRAHSTLDALHALHRAASARLVVLLGEPSDVVAVQADGEPLAFDPPVADGLGALLGSHPLAHRARAATRAADAASESERRARWPQLSLTVQDWVSRQTRRNDVRVIGAVDVPLFDRPRISRAEAARRAAEVDADAVRARLLAEAVAARAEYVAAERRCEALESSVVPAMHEAATRSQEAYAQGSLDLAATQTAEQARSDADRALLTCLAQRARAWARLEFALGGPRER